MRTVLILLLIQGCLGAFDTLWYHEFKLRLVLVPDARKELRLHAYRDFIYTVVFGSLAWVTYNGLYAWILFVLLFAEIAITLQDFIQEDRTRKVPSGEHAMHALMGIVYGAILAYLLPQVISWSRLPSSFAQKSYGMISWLLTVMAIGVFFSGLRDLHASRSTPFVRVTLETKCI